MYNCLRLYLYFSQRDVLVFVLLSLKKKLLALLVMSIQKSCTLSLYILPWVTSEDRNLYELGYCVGFLSILVLQVVSGMSWVCQCCGCSELSILIWMKSSFLLSLDREVALFSLNFWYVSTCKKFLKPLKELFISRNFQTGSSRLIFMPNLHIAFKILLRDEYVWSFRTPHTGNTHAHSLSHIVFAVFSPPAWFTVIIVMSNLRFPPRIKDPEIYSTHVVGGDWHLINLCILFLSQWHLSLRHAS